MLSARFRRFAMVAAAAAVALGVGGCKSLLEVNNEQDILDKNLDNPDAVAPLMNGVIGDYALAYANAIDIILTAEELDLLDTLDPRGARYPEASIPTSTSPPLPEA